MQQSGMGHITSDGSTLSFEKAWGIDGVGAMKGLVSGCLRQ